MLARRFSVRPRDPGPDEILEALADGDAAGASARTYQHIMGADPVKDTETDR